MRKGTLAAALAAALVFVGTGCDTSVTLDKPTVITAALETDKGATLRLTWTAVNDAKEYQITAGDSIYKTTFTSVDISTPSATIEVRAVNGNNKSDPAIIDCKIVETASITIYGISDTDTTHHGGMGFNSDGTITTYSLSYTDKARLDFYADDIIYPGDMYLLNPGDKGWNAKGNAVKEAATSNYSDAMLADAPGTGYITQLAIVSGGVYYLWLDRTNNGWSTDDNFAKAKIISIAGPLVTMQVGYQKIDGLRWLAE